MTALQKMSNKARELSESASALARDAENDVAPAMSMCTVVGTVLSEPEKYMYSRGMEEEWRELVKMKDPVRPPLGKLI